MNAISQFVRRHASSYYSSTPATAKLDAELTGTRHPHTFKTPLVPRPLPSPVVTLQTFHITGTSAASLPYVQCSARGPLLDRAVIIADVPPILDHRDDEGSGQEDSENGYVLVATLFRVLLLLERADSEVRLSHACSRVRKEK